MEPGKYVQKIEVTRYIGEADTLDSLIAWLGWGLADANWPKGSPSEEGRT